ncbi:MAG: MFS transporter [Promethearchaeota archaeon]
MESITSEGIPLHLKRRNVWAFLFGNGLYGFSDAVFIVAYNVYLYELTGDLFLVGFYLTLGMILYFIPQPLTGRISDRIGHKKAMILVEPVNIMGLVLLILAKDFGLFWIPISIILRNSVNSAKELNYKIIVAESGEVTNNKIGFLFSSMNFIYFGTSIVGSLFITLTNFDLRVYFLIYIANVTLNWLKNVIFITDPNQSGLRKEKIPFKTVWKQIYRKKVVQIAAFYFTMDILIFQISGSVYNTGLIDYFGFTQQDLGFLTLIFNITMMVFQIPGGKMVDKFGKRKTLMLSLLSGIMIYSISIISWILWSHNFVAILIPSLITVQILSGMGASTFIPSETMIMTDLDKTRKAESYGIVSFVRGIGSIPTGIIGGFLMSRVHYIAPFIVTLLGIFFLLWFLLRYGKNFDNFEKI